MWMLPGSQFWVVAGNPCWGAGSSPQAVVAGSLLVVGHRWWTFDRQGEWAAGCLYELPPQKAGPEANRTFQVGHKIGAMQEVGNPSLEGGRTVLVLE